MALNRCTSWCSNQGRYRQKQMCSLIFKTKSFYIPSICFYLFLPVSNKNSRKCNDWCFLFCFCIKLYSVTLTLLHIVWTISLSFLLVNFYRFTRLNIGNCHTRLHLGYSAKLRIEQVPACKMEPRSGISFGQNQPR